MEKIGRVAVDGNLSHYKKILAKGNFGMGRSEKVSKVYAKFMI